MCLKIDVMERECKNYNIWGASKQAPNLELNLQLLTSPGVPYRHCRNNGRVKVKMVRL
jgi:hypothetical protein